MTRRTFWWMSALVAAVLASGVGVVYAKYLTRMEFGRLQDLNQKQRGLEERWTLLRLEEASLSTHPLVEQAARTRLGLYLPRAVDVRTIEGVGHDR